MLIKSYIVGWFITNTKMATGFLQSVDSDGYNVRTDKADPTTELKIKWECDPKIVQIIEEHYEPKLDSYDSN